MRSNNIILDSNVETDGFFQDEIKGILKSMKEHAIEFAKEINRQGYIEYDESDKWIKIEESNTVYTTEQLYDKFGKRK